MVKEMKYQKVLIDIKNKIKSGYFKIGQTLPSENEMTTEYGVSRYTIRKAYDILEQEGYIYAEHGKGRFLSEQMPHLKKSKNIVVITTYISDYIFPQVIKGIDNVLEQNGYSIILKNTNNMRKKEIECLQEVVEKDIEGIIIEPSRSQIYCQHSELFSRLDAYHVPYVFIQGIYRQIMNCPYVIMDDYKGGFLVTDYLIKQGHKKIAGIFKFDDVQGQQRHKGYVKALQEAGRMYDPELVIWFNTEDRKVQPSEEIKRLSTIYKDIDGIVCYNDQIAIDVIEAINEMSLSVPEDISVVGFDNSNMAKTYPTRLTTVSHPQEKLGEMAAELLLKLIQTGNSQSTIDNQILIEPELIIGKSSRNRDL